MFGLKISVQIKTFAQLLPSCVSVWHWKSVFVFLFVFECFCICICLCLCISRVLCDRVSISMVLTEYLCTNCKVFVWYFYGVDRVFVFPGCCVTECASVWYWQSGRHHWHPCPAIEYSPNPPTLCTPAFYQHQHHHCQYHLHHHHLPYVFTISCCCLLLKVFWQLVVFI